MGFKVCPCESRHPKLDPITISRKRRFESFDGGYKLYQCGSIQCYLLMLLYSVLLDYSSRNLEIECQPATAYKLSHDRQMLQSHRLTWMPTMTHRMPSRNHSRLSRWMTKSSPNTPTTFEARPNRVNIRQTKNEVTSSASN